MVNRSGQPSELNFPFLEKLKLNSIVWLAPEDPSPRFLNWMDDQEIKLNHLGVENSIGYDPITFVLPLFSPSHSVERSTDVVDVTMTEKK